VNNEQFLDELMRRDAGMDAGIDATTRDEFMAAGRAGGAAAPRCGMESVP
jgi:hypothetical protein